MPMARGYGGSLAGFGSFSAGSTPHDSRLTNHDDIPPETQQFLEHASAGNFYPSPDELSLYARRTNFSIGTIRKWFNSRSDRSDFIEPTVLSSTGFLSPQNDLLAGNSSWINDKPEAFADSAYFSNVSAGPGPAAHDHDLPNLYATQFPLHIPTESPSDDLSGETQQQDLPAVGWDRTYNRAQNFFDPTYSLAGDGQSSYPVFKFDNPPYSAGDRSTAASLVSKLQPLAVSSEAIGSPRTRSRSKRTSPSIKSQGEDAVCEQCGAKFTGRYARGNCARHSRLYHSDSLAPPGSDRVCRTCHKHFKRQDARRKHEWRKHGILDAKPHSRRQAPSIKYEPSHTGTQESDDDGDTLSCNTAFQEQSSVEPQYHVPAGEHRAHRHFAEAWNTLAGSYNIYCRVVLLHCERIVAWLRIVQPALHTIFARQLQDLCMQLLHDQYKSLGFHSFTEVDLEDTQNENDHDHDDNNEGTHQDKGKSRVDRRASKGSSRSHPYSGRPAKRSAADPLAIAMEQFELPLNRDLDCPIHKWNLMKGQGSPCNGCGKEHMNGVRQHLLPTYSQQHQAQLPFIRRCDNCKEDIVDEHVWTQGGHRARKQQQAVGACRAKSQPQGNSVVVWARLFLKIFTEETQVPSPYRNDRRFLPADLVALLRSSLELQQFTPSNHSQALPLQTNSLSSPVPPRQTGTQLEHDAATDTLVTRATELLAHFLAQDLAEETHEQIDLEEFVAYYRDRIDELRRNARLELIQPYRPESQAATQDPAIGGANDWPVPTVHGYNPIDYTVQMPNSGSGTIPSSHEHHTSEVSLGFPSSSTSHEFVNPASMGWPQQVEMQTYTPSNLADYSPLAQNHGQWPSQFDDYLNVPGPSTLPQQLALQTQHLQVPSDFDFPMMSPSESHYGPMETDDDAFFDGT